MENRAHEKGASFHRVPLVDRSFNCPFSPSSFLSQGCRSFKRLLHSVLASFCTSIPPNGQVPLPRYSHNSERLWCLSRAISISTRPPTIGRSCNGQSWVPIRPHLPEQCYRERFNVLL